MRVSGRVRAMLPHRLIRDGDHTPLRLTRLSMVEGGYPEDEEIDLAPYSGKRIGADCESAGDEWAWGVGDILVEEERDR